MKIKLLVTLLLVTAISNAQNIRYGFKAGLNLSSLSAKSGATISSSTSSKTSFVLGGFAEFKINNKFSIQPEILYANDGGTYNYKKIILTSIVTYDYTQVINLKTFTLPIIAKYYVTNSKNISIDMGPYITYIFDANSKTNLFSSVFTLSSETSTIPSDQTTFTSNQGGVDVTKHDYGYNKLNYGLNIGGTYNLKNGLFLNLRYNYVLSKFLSNANPLTTEIKASNLLIEPDLKNTEIKNSNFQVTLGYNFN